jgi:hypothetical protein
MSTLTLVLASHIVGPFDRRDARRRGFDKGSWTGHEQPQILQGRQIR